MERARVHSSLSVAPDTVEGVSPVRRSAASRHRLECGNASFERKNMRARIIATSLLFGVLLPTTPHRLAAVAEPKPAPQVSASEFEAVAPPERLDFVKALLRARDAALQNFSYHVVEIKNNIDLEDGSRTPFAKEEYFVRRLGATHWMRLVVCGPDSKVEADGVMNWDGERAMSFTRFTNREEVRGMIRDRENNNFTFRAFNQILGFRVLGDGPVMSVADWVARYPNASRRLEAAVENRGGKAMLKVKVFWDREYKSFWFDFERGLMAVRTEYRYESPDKQRYNKEYTDVVMAEEVAGLWVPTRAVLGPALPRVARRPRPRPAR